MALNRVSASEVRRMEAPDWQVEGLVPEGALVMIFGPEGSHKTFFGMDMSCCVGTGEDFHGRKVKKGRVLYVAAEGGTPIAKRLRSWEQEHARFIKDSELTLVMEPLILDDVDEVDEAIAELENDDNPYALIVFDTLNMCMLGNESSPHEVARVVRAAKRFSALFGSTVIIIHHTPKENPNTHRGSGALSAALTTNIKVYFDGDDSTTITCVKQKDHEHFETMVFTHHVLGESLVLREVEDADKRVKATEKAVNKVSADNREATMVQIVKQNEQGLERKEVVSLAIEKGIPSSSAYKVIDRLERKKLIRVNEDGLVLPK